MNELVERIRQATGNLAAESGDVGSGDNSQQIVSKKLADDIKQFQTAFASNLEELRQREDVVLQILQAQEQAMKRGLFADQPKSEKRLYKDLNKLLSPDTRVPMESQGTNEEDSIDNNYK